MREPELRRPRRHMPSAGSRVESVPFTPQAITWPIPIPAAIPFNSVTIPARYRRSFDGFFEWPIDIFRNIQYLGVEILQMGTFHGFVCSLRFRVNGRRVPCVYPWYGNIFVTNAPAPMTICADGEPADGSIEPMATLLPISVLFHFDLSPPAGPPMEKRSFDDMYTVTDKAVVCRRPPVAHMKS